VARFDLTLEYLDDTRMQASVALRKQAKILFQGDYDVRLDSPRPKDKGQLEARAYRLVDSLVSRILLDEKFRKGLKKAEPAAEGQEKPNRAIKNI
jgi:hypothetical protein